MKKLMLCLGMLAAPALAVAELIEFKPSTPAKASEVNSNFKHLQDRITILENIIRTKTGQVMSDKSLRDLFIGVWEVDIPAYSLTCSNGTVVEFSKENILVSTYNPYYSSTSSHLFLVDNDKVELELVFNGGNTSFYQSQRYNYSIFSGSLEYKFKNNSYFLRFDPLDINKITGFIEYIDVTFEQDDNQVICNGIERTNIVLNRF